MSSLRSGAIWDILVEEAGAPDGVVERAGFDYHWPGCREYRFDGALGFGGKLWVGNPPYVTCYPEDMTPERQAIIANIDARLADLFENAVGEQPQQRERSVPCKHCLKPTWNVSGTCNLCGNGGVR